MAKIITKPKELEKNEQVLYAGNHYISVPEICCTDGSIKNLNIVSLMNKALVELEGEAALLTPTFSRGQRTLCITKVDCHKEYYYIPKITFYLDDGTVIEGRIYTDLKEKGLIYDFAQISQPLHGRVEELSVQLTCDLRYMNFLRFNSYHNQFTKTVYQDKWLGNPVIYLVSQTASLGLAFGGDSDFTYEEKSQEDLVVLKMTLKERNCFYLSINSDPDGASTTLIHLRRKGLHKIYEEFILWLSAKQIAYPKDLILEKRLNENLFFNYFFAVGKDLGTDAYMALTSRSPRYYVSGAFWERDSFLWSMPAIRLIDPTLHTELVRQLVLTHSKNPGDHAHYIDGTVLYPGFELDEAASYFIVTEGQDEKFYDEEMIKALERVWMRIEEEYSPETGLYKTFLLPSDDPADHPFVTIDNVILWRGLANYRKILLMRGKSDKAKVIQERIEGIRQGIYHFLVKDVQGKKMFLWSTDGHGQYRIYNDPPGNLGLLPFYGFVDPSDPIFKNTIEYYYSEQYSYYFANARFKELACDHHPNTPSGLGLCGTLLNPLKTAEALEWVREVTMDYGLLCESFDAYTGEGKTGVGFATGAGYLAYALYHVLMERKEQ